MSFVIRTGHADKRATVIVEREGNVIELRAGNRTFPYGRQGAQRAWDSVADWVTEEHIDIETLVYSKKELSSDGQKVIDIMASFMRKPNMSKSSKSLNGYKYKLDSYIFVFEKGRLIPFYVASDGTMLYNYSLGKTFSELELVDPEFWVKDRGNQIVRFVSPV